MPYNSRYDYIAKLLLPLNPNYDNADGYDYDVRTDRNNFNRYYNKQITLEECLRLFRKNNMIDDDDVIILEDFKGWLAELGYARRENEQSYFDW